MADRPLPPENRAADPAVPWARVEHFLGQLTHDLRNGLNALELQLTYLGEICVEPEAAEETRRLRASLSAVSRQLQALRKATCLPALTLMPYPAGEFFADLRERFERLEPAATPRVDWSILLPDASLLRVDPETTLSAILELLANAVQFGGDHPDFSVLVKSDDGSRASVLLTERKPAQTAPIDTAAWGRKPFQSSRRSAYGLGLFRAARVFEAQGGAISAVYAEPERTLTTTVTLPMAALA